MAAENENVPMVFDGEADEEDSTANVGVEALNEALDEGIFLPLPKWQLLRLPLLRAMTSVFRSNPALKCHLPLLPRVLTHLVLLTMPSRLLLNRWHLLLTLWGV